MGRSRNLDTCVVHKHVETAELLDSAVEHGDDVLLLGHVAADEHVANAGLPHAREASVHPLLGILCVLRSA